MVRVDQSAILVNGTVINGLQSPPSGWFEAIVQGAVYLAATKSRKESLEFQQLAVSHAAHDTLLWTFHGTRLYATINSKIRYVIPLIGLDPASSIGKKATQVSIFRKNVYIQMLTKIDWTRCRGQSHKGES